MVVRLAPFHRTTEDGTKLAPLTVRVKALPPAVAVLGETLLSVGAGLRTEKLAGADVPPPGVGVTTVTAKVPAVAMSPAGIVAVSDVALPKAVARSTPFHRTIEDATKLVPVTVSGKPAPAALAEPGRGSTTVRGAGCCTDRLTPFDKGALGVEDRDAEGPRDGDVGSGDRRGQLSRRHERGDPIAGVDPDRRGGGEIRAGDGEREGRAPDERPGME